MSSYEQMCGCSYRAVYAVGCVDGFVPARDAFEVVSTHGREQGMAAAGAVGLDERAAGIVALGQALGAGVGLGLAATR